MRKLAMVWENTKKSRQSQCPETACQMMLQKLKSATQRWLKNDPAPAAHLFYSSLEDSLIVCIAFVM